MGKESNFVDLSMLEKELPPIVFRNFPKWKDLLPIARGTIANMDCVGLGPKERIICCRVVGYPRESLIEWLRERSRIIQSKPKVIL